MLRRAFTLVELLVVVAIIGMLIGIIVPSARAIQRESQNAGCLSNLRQDFIAVDSFRQQNSGRLPMCEFLPVVTNAGIDGGLPNFLSGFLPANSPSWICPADQDEQSLSTGTSYMYLPGLLRYTPAVQVDVVTLLMSFDPATTSMDRLMSVRLDAEARAMTDFFEREAARYPLLTDSQDRHRRVGVERNGVYIDGSARIAVDLTADAETGTTP
ncbi:MAG: type II secretion system protein [Planctomycetota bacterium]|nr:type II secretion system protein [Planctomycetota bacterium]